MVYSSFSLNPADNYRENCGVQSWETGQKSSTQRMLSWGSYFIYILPLLKSNLGSRKTQDHTKYNYYHYSLWSPSCLFRHIVENHVLQVFPRNHVFRAYKVPFEQEHLALWLHHYGPLSKERSFIFLFTRLM